MSGQRPFRYLRDLLFLACVVVYVINRFIVKQYFPNTFSGGYLNDLICIPFCVPIMLWLMKRAGVRDYDGPPRAAEIMIPLLVWAVAFELWLPGWEVFEGRMVSDPIDVLCYVVGAYGAMVWWDWYYGVRRSRQP